MSNIQKKSMTILLPTKVWQVAQLVLWLVGVLFVALLLFKPDLGVLLFWNLLIPIAPAILVVFPGVWRNICPMSSTALTPKKFHLSKPIKLSQKTQSRLYFAGVVALLLIVPLRHLLLNFNGPATAIMLLLAAAFATIMGMFVEWRSGWCATACPIHSVERLYGSTPLFTTDNAHCASCEKCVSICPDSTKQMTSTKTRNNSTEKLAGTVLTGGFFGYIWGWYQVPDYRGVIDFATVVSAYAWPLIGGLASLIPYLIIKGKLTNKQQQVLNRLFATAAVACYYWFRIPSLFGVGIFPTDGVLIDLSASLPTWFSLAAQLTSASFFIWFMLIRPQSREKQSWTIRPQYSLNSKVG